MKKMIMTLAIVVSSIVAFAGEENVNTTVLNAFKKEFSTARDVQWTSGADFYKASFVFNNQHITAFYSLEGQLVGTTRNISSLDLPLNLQTKLKNDYSAYWISDLFELSNNEGTNYYITLEKADGKIVLQSLSGAQWSTYKKMTKI